MVLWYLSSFLLLLILIYVAKVINRRLRLPPGPFPVPVLGCNPYFKQGFMYKYLQELTTKYGPIMSVPLVIAEQILLSDPKIIAEAMARPEFQGRPPFAIMQMFCEGVVRPDRSSCGLLASEGKAWSDNRRFALKAMKDFGFGKATQQDMIISLFNGILDHFQSFQGKPFIIDTQLDVAIINIVWHAVAGVQYDLGDKRVQGIVNNFQFILDGNTKLGLAVSLKFLRWLDPKKEALYKELEDNIHQAKTFLKEVIAAHKETLDENDTQDMIDRYLVEIPHHENQPNPSFDEFELSRVIEDLFMAGADTTTSTIRWGILLLMLNPEVQTKCQEELDRVLSGREVTLDDRSRLPYIEAMTMEIQRLGNIAPLGVYHQVLEDTYLAGYFIPKGAFLTTNMMGCHMNPRYWRDPEKFDPTRFLDEDGVVISKHPAFMPFGLGRRRCIGENLAKIELFLFFALLLQRFTLFPSPEDEGKSLGDYQGPVRSLILSPEPYQVRVEERNQ